LKLLSSLNGNGNYVLSPRALSKLINYTRCLLSCCVYLNQSINHWFIKTGDKPQLLNTVDNKIATIKRKIMNA